MSKPGKPIWPKVPAPFVRAVLAGHSSLGLAFAALIYLVCVSGTVAVYTMEFQRWERPDAPPIGSVTPATIQTAVENAVTQYGKSEHIFISLPTWDAPRLNLYLDQGKDDVEVSADTEGRLQGHAETPWTQFMTRLHINLHLPQTWGIFVVGLTGVALLSSLISGIFAHPRIFRDAFHLRWGGSKRLQEADLHNRIGIWALPFHITIALTGALLGLTTIIVGVLALAVFKGDTEKAYALFLPPQPIDNPATAPLPDIEAAMANLARIAPAGAKPSYLALEHPGEAGAGVLIIAGTGETLSRGDSYVFDRTGKPIREQGIGSETVGAAIIQALSQLHFGWFGGWPMKIVYGLLGMGLTVVTTSGVAIWLARRRDKGRAAPRWERVWISTVWSQPVAFATAAVTSFTWPDVTVAVWGVATLVAMASAIIWEPKEISRRLRLASAALMVAAVAAHLVAWWGRISDPMAWIVDGSILALAVVLALTVLRPLGARKAAPVANPAPAE